MCRIRLIRFTLAILVIALLVSLLPSNVTANQHVVRGSKEGQLKVELINGEEMNDFLKHATRDSHVRMLQKLLIDLHGYVLRPETAIAAKVSRNGKEIMRVLLVPYQEKAGTWRGHVAFWEGEWNGIRDRGAIATDGRDKVYVPGEDGIRRISVDDLENELVLPLNAIVGPTPPWMPRYTVYQKRSVMDRVRSTATYIEVDVPLTAYTLLGFVAYRFHQVKSWVYDGNTVSDVNVYVYLSDVDPNFVYRGIVNSTDNWGPGHTWHYSFRQAHVENCIVKYGCIGSTYPYIWIRAMNDGTSPFDRGF